jgi:hypothetical protein
MSICQCSDFDCVPKSSAWNTVVSETVIDVGAIKISPTEYRKVPFPQSLLGAGGATAATYLVAAVPWLGFAGAPVVAGVLVVIGTIGMDAFRDWAMKLEEPYQADRDR